MIHPDPKHKAVRLTGKAYTAFRKDVCERANGVCEECGNPAPLLEGVDTMVFNVFTCGHVSHIKSHGAGGGDTMDNVKWKCYTCHIGKEHTKGVK